MTQKRQITVDGVDYIVEFDTIEGDPGVIWVYDIHGKKIADAEWDYAAEQLFFSYFDDDGRMEDFDGASSDLFRKPPLEVAAWLVSTFPGV